LWIVDQSFASIATSRCPSQFLLLFEDDRVVVVVVYYFIVLFLLLLFLRNFRGCVNEWLWGTSTQEGCTDACGTIIFSTWLTANKLKDLQ